MMKSMISSDVFLHVPDTITVRDDSESSLSSLKGSIRGPRDAEKHVEDGTHPEKENYVENENHGESESENEGESGNEVGRYLIFFITGNPGLIGYYRPFLSRLVRGLRGDIRGLEQGRLDGIGSTGTDRKNLPGHETGKASAKSRSRRKAEVVVFGGSLGGFEIDGIGGGRDTQIEENQHEIEINNEDGNRDGLGNEDGDADAGFEDNLLFPTSTMKQRRRQRDVIGLPAQVELCIARLKEVVRRMNIREPSENQNQNQNRSRNQSSPGTRDMKKNSTDSRDSKTKGRIKVILIGHSVGAWIALEMIHQLRQLKNSTSPPSSPPNAINTPPDTSFAITAALLLTPTILELALSNTGRLAAPVMGSFLGGYLPSVAQYGAAALSLVVKAVGERRVRGFVGGVTGMGGHGGGDRRYLGSDGGEQKRKQKQEAGDGEDEGEGEGEGEGENEGGNGLDVTIKFLLSANGVRQALALAGEEFKMITSDGWGEEVWGGAGVGERTGNTKSPKLYFLFAGKDHWVADETREKIIQRTGQPELEGRHVLEIDEQLEHAWCLRQSGRIADKVGKWIEEIIENGD